MTLDLRFEALGRTPSLAYFPFHIIYPKFLVLKFVQFLCSVRHLWFNLG